MFLIFIVLEILNIIFIFLDYYNRSLYKSEALSIFELVVIYPLRLPKENDRKNVDNKMKKLIIIQNNL